MKSIRAMLLRGACLLLLIAGLLYPCAAAAEEASALPKHIDCTDDQLAYGEAVASLNRQALSGVIGNSGAKKAPGALWPVLCRTDGIAFDFDAWGPRYVISGPSDCFTLYFDSEAEAAEAAAALSALPCLRYAEPDSPVEASGTGDPTFYSWGAAAMAYGPYLRYSRGIVAGSAMIAVIDSGISLHPMYADRVQESGHDYIDGDGDSMQDPFGHGTNVAGILTDCTQGFPAYLYPIRVLNETGAGSIGNTVNAIREAIEKKVDIINLSLSAKNISQALDEAVTDALHAGITVVAAAGNYAMDTAGLSPGHLTEPGILIVGAAEADGTRADYSNYGGSVDVYAYGTAINCCANDGGFTEATGTSMAAPHISGLAALLVLTHRGISPAEIETRVCLSTDRTAQAAIPRLTHIVPDHPAFSLQLLKMDLHDRIRLNTTVRPAAAMETAELSSSDESVITVADGELIPVGPGRAKIIAHCPGLPNTVFVVEVTQEPCTTLSLPVGLRCVENGAFYGTAAAHVVLPVDCESIGEAAFEGCGALKTVEIRRLPPDLIDLAVSDAVVLFSGSEEAEETLRELQIPYICEMIQNPK